MKTKSEFRTSLISTTDLSVTRADRWKPITIVTKILEVLDRPEKIVEKSMIK